MKKIIDNFKIIVYTNIVKHKNEIKYIVHDSLAQLVEHLTFNPVVPRSSRG